ncbi:hypothetical protein V1508DRAFT_424357 [Lipomyces doorenjongii]|uniref:uncharacterized protein n=1 Tax=Lipomyces doorenjongii TaxID=383834 RepID=UPI0034CE8478
MRLESRWRILKRDYTSRLVRPRLDSLCYVICTSLVKSRLHINELFQERLPSSCSVDVTSATRAVVTGEVSAWALN